jgi:NADH-quinone oxidoreductase subunit A
MLTVRGSQATGRTVTMRPACAGRPARGNGRHVLDNYLPILIFLAVAGGFGLLLLALGWVLGPRRPDAEKVSAYECGFEPFEDTRSRFDVRYYLVAILFIIFDLEIAFLFPWAVSLDTVGGFGLVSMGIFLAVLVVGFIYEWKKGALEWD